MKKDDSEKEVYPILSINERDFRWQNIRWKMDLHGVDCLLVWGNESKWKTALANIRYITNKILPGILLFPREGEPIVWSGFPHGAKAEKSHGSWINDVRPGNLITDIVKTIKDLGYEKSNIGIVGFNRSQPQVVPDSVLYLQYKKITEELPNAHFHDSSGILDELRMIKSKEEISMLEKSSRLAEAMYDAILYSAKPGKRECEIYANMLQAAIKNGGEEDMIWLSAGPLPPPHAKKPPPSTRKLEKGDIIVTEFHSNYQGYLSGIEHSVSLGKPKNEFIKIHEVCMAAQENGIKAMTTGALLNEVIDAFRKPIIDAGMNFVECGFHGHGLASPEFPSCMYGGHAGQWEWHPYAIVPPIRLTENMVFGTAADVFDPKWNQTTGLMLGDTVLITKEGPRKLTVVPFELTVI